MGSPPCAPQATPSLSRSRGLSLAMAACVAILAACQTGPDGVSPGEAETERDATRSVALTREALSVAASDPAEAEMLLQSAIRADPFNGAALNNLGVILLDRGALYEAAQSFEAAGRALPGQPDPRLNLGLVFEQAGKVDEALDAYRTALEVSPEHLPTIQALTRAELRWDRTTEDTTKRLRRLMIQGDTEAWRSWARQQEMKR